MAMLDMPHTPAPMDSIVSAAFANNVLRSLDPETIQAPVPIHILPPELLIEVFLNCCSNDTLSPLILRRVSWSWKYIVDTSPRLWQTISLRDASSGYSATQHAKLWTERSEPLGFDVELNTDDSDSILPLLAPLLSSVDRWRTLRFTGRREEEVLFQDLKLTPDTLTHLHLFLHDEELDDLEDEDTLARITFTSTFPDQTYDSTFAMNVWLSAIPSSSVLPPLRFTHITMSEGGMIGVHATSRDILNFLLACPELESFHLSGWPRDGPVDGSLPSTYLPNLVHMHLKSTCSVRALLSSLIVPRLEYLYLSHINVDFRLQDEHHEEGDSEDEAQDYSQSPWSDHATGMGLRKLIKRCNPPIKILDMDFCDIRTKDFRYVFDQLTMLQEFRIVASDMSDTVINLLRPIPSEKNEIATRPRLPRLRTLKLHNCQRLTGTAIADALAERVKWTDRHFPESTLVDVMIDNCDGFTQWDRHILSQAIGSRLRVNL